MKRIFLCIYIVILTFSTVLSVNAIEQDYEKIEVTDIVISDFSDKLEVDETLSLSVTVLPANADEQNITYKSSDSSIATVSATGEIKGISPGKVKIYVSAGQIKKELKINVKISAKGIRLENDLVILKPGQTFQTNASIYPSNASNKSVKYSSSNEEIATVTEEGTIQAIGVGTTSIVVKNDDAIASVTVIVNEHTKQNEGHSQPTISEPVFEIPKSVTANDYPQITPEMLKYLYDESESISVTSEEYTLIINGRDIKNTSNALNTDISLKSENDNLFFTLNYGTNLHGDTIVEIKNADKYKYLYLYNEHKDKYDLITKNDLRKLVLSSSGKYMLTNSRISSTSIPWVAIVISSVVILILSCFYIVIKRKYWFW